MTAATIRNAFASRIERVGCLDPLSTVASMDPQPSQSANARRAPILRFWSAMFTFHHQGDAAPGRPLRKESPMSTELIPRPDGAPPSRHLASEEIVVAAPFSFAGSAARLWKIRRASDELPYKIALTVCAIAAIAVVWSLVLGWYLLWGVFLVPYRLIRRGARKRKREALMHREQLAALEAIQRDGQR